MKPKNWLISLTALVLGVLLIMAGTVAVLDPFLHYHKPLTNLMYYDLNNQRSHNDGMIRHLQYDAMFVGTSMTENTPVSQVDELFRVHCIKIPNSGAAFPELDRYVRAAIGYNPDLKLVFRCLDTDFLLTTDEAMFYAEGEIPEYLYNQNPFDDVKYLLSMEVFLNRCIQPFMGGILNGTRGMTDLDAYSAWENSYPNGREYLLKDAEPFTPPTKEAALTDAERALIRKNLMENAVNTALENPDVTFYYFLPPYSVLWWGDQWQMGRLQRAIDIQRTALETLVGYENIHVFSLNTDLSITENLDNYRDAAHYLTRVNEMITAAMAAGEYEITKENLPDHIRALEEIYLPYDYNGIFEK